MVSTWDAPVQKELMLVEEQLRESVHSEQPLLTEISNYIITSGGKRMRPAVAILVFKATGGKDPEKVIKVASAFELIHSATLIHDDINDHGEMRRGRQAAYKKYGTQKALIAGDFLFVKSFALGGAFDEKVIGVVADACTGIAESEILQSDYEHDQETNVNVYISIIEGKTARPFEAGARVGSYLADATPAVMEAMGSYGMNIGIAFQIVDDILDVTGDEASLGKPHGIDIVDGKPTLPLIIAMQDKVHGARIKEIFRKEKKSPEEVAEAIALVKKTKALEESSDMAEEYANKALLDLEVLRPSDYKEALKALTKAILDRKS
ncbi:MAG TPA: polyprenyl synthetase family protein [Methanomassiliicoccales archaeon]|jgi:octaprenyl-diphosphate synthase